MIEVNFCMINIIGRRVIIVVEITENEKYHLFVLNILIRINHVEIWKVKYMILNSIICLNNSFYCLEVFNI